MPAEDDADPDDHFVLIDGRRWRATDPSIPAAFRTELVNELMDARRAVGHITRRHGDPSAQRARVHDAKVALGERGERWWLDPSEDGRGQRIEATIRALLRSRAPESSICPSDVARAIGGDSWRSLVPLVRTTAAELAASDTIVVTQGDETVDVTTARGPVRLRRGPALSDS